MASSVKLHLALLLLPCFLVDLSAAQVKIPRKPTGFVYTEDLVREESITIDAFFDVLCPDSRDSWPHLKRVVEEYSPRIFLQVHIMPLPYHEDSYSAARAVHIAHKWNSSYTFPVFEAILQNQVSFYGQNTRKLTGETILKKLERVTAKAIGTRGALSMVKSGFKDVKTDLAARTAFKYGSSRGVIATPYFFLNGFALPGEGAVLEYKTWKSHIDRLLALKN